MTLRLLAGAALIAIAMAGPASAAAAHGTVPAKPTPAGVCVALEDQYTDALPGHTKARFAAAAKVREARGTAACTAGKYKMGEWELTRALHDLDVQAKVEGH